MYNELYDVTVLEKNIQNRLIKNYEIAANRAKVGHVGSDCFWVRQTLAGIVMEALPFSTYINSKMHDSLYNLYIKLSTE
jgi:hypothetical protein